MSKLITDAAAILGTFPFSLARDEDKEKLAESIVGSLAELMADTDKEQIYTQISSLDEPLLDILAKDLKVDWYDYEGTLSEKRKTIAECINVHRYKGTKYAVETALKGVYDNVIVSEWYEYNGEPYHFKVTIYDSTNNEEKRARVLEKIQYYKNLRSVLDDVVYQIGKSADMPLKIGIKAGAIYKKSGKEVKMYELG